MPVFVTGADLGIGPALVAALRADGADVRAFATGTGDVASVRAAGAFVAVGDLDDEGHLDAAMTDAHTVVIPTETWSSGPEVLVTTTTAITRAAVLAAVSRIVFVSLCGARIHAPAPLLAAYGRAEEVVAAAGMQTLVVRTDGILDHGFLDVVSGVSGCDDEVVAPVAADRLIDGLVALDRARSSRADGHAVFTALGQPATVAAWRRRLTGVEGSDTDQGQAPQPGTGGGGLVGSRWLVPDRRRDLTAILSGRGGPPRDGADLWDLVDGGDAA